MFTAKKVAYTAALCALCVLANIFSIPVSGSNYISFVYLVCFVAAIYLDLPLALIVAAVGDLLGCLISPKAAFNPLIFVSNVLLGLIPALVFRIKNLNAVLKLIIGMSLCLFIVTAGINTYALWLMYGIGKKTFWVYLIGRLPFQCITAAVNSVLIYAVLKTKVFEKLLKEKDYDKNTAKTD